MVNTSSEAIQRLEQVSAQMGEIVQIINNLMVEHEYQDVASLVTQAANQLLNAATALLRSQDEVALEALENADDLLDSVYEIIDAETDED